MPALRGEALEQTAMPSRFSKRELAASERRIAANFAAAQNIRDEETEACAMLAETIRAEPPAYSVDPDFYSACDVIADRIRARIAARKA